MYLILDDDKKITEFIAIGVKPNGDNVIEIDEIDKDILSDIFNYKYINGEFVHITTNPLLSKIDELKKLKIQNLSVICNNEISGGIDYNGGHYSLKTEDQINLSNIKGVALMTPEVPLFYHADNEVCRQYTNEEILNLTTVATIWVTFHTTYFNFLKHYINTLTDPDTIIAIDYGTQLPEPYKTNLDNIVGDNVLSTKLIHDDFDYDMLIPKVNTNQIISDLNEYKDAIESNKEREIKIAEYEEECERMREVPPMTEPSEDDESETENDIETDDDINTEINTENNTEATNETNININTDTENTIEPSTENNVTNNDETNADD